MRMLNISILPLHVFTLLLYFSLIGRVKKAERSEPSLEVSEYHLVKSGVTNKDAVCIRDLIKSLERKGDQSNITKKLRYIQQKNKVLPKPLEKPAAERVN